ncbi:hypothetical protein KQX54_020788 [Cotesia glomerata]|uniref:Uncharacterized protein n=1 Tax=Cotesia glomerata TaxID=32391 RepID=A0AAV7I6Z0_COTGL|nr:hypothetical protein KQX54_020788 [Cotesia glomerata]
MGCECVGKERTRKIEVVWELRELYQSFVGIRKGQRRSAGASASAKWKKKILDFLCRKNGEREKKRDIIISWDNGRRIVISVRIGWYTPCSALKRMRWPWVLGGGW